MAERIDAHHHLWRYSKEEYGWIGSGMEAIARDFLPGDLQSELKACGIDASVAVQARESLAETDWLLEMAESSPAIRGVVGWAPISAPDFPRALEKLKTRKKLKGLRHIIQAEPDDEFILRDDFNAGIAALSGSGLVYDILIYERHLPAAIQFVDRHPNQIFVLDHVAKPRIKDHILETWRSNLIELAKRENVYCKLSGMVTEADWKNWNATELQPYADAALEAFGPNRLMFGSDWPVCLLGATYAKWFETAQDFLGALSTSEKELVFGGVASKVYSLESTYFGIRRSTQFDLLAKRRRMPIQPPVPVDKSSSPSSSPSAASPSSSHALFPSGQIVPFSLVTFLFFLWGIPNSMNDVLIRQFMKSFEISRFQAGLVQSAFYMGYFVLAIPAALLMKRSGYKAGFITGLLLLGTGAFLFWPAALAGKYGFFLIALFVMAGGLSFLETASNPFIAQLGDPASSERRLNFSQAFNPLGNITAALVGTIFIFSGIELSKAEIANRMASGTYQSYLRFETLRVVEPYVVIAAVAFVWAILIWRTKFPQIQSESEEGGEHGRFSELLRERHFVLAVIAQFFYVGAQVCTWSYLISYAQEYAHLPEKKAGMLLVGNFALFGVGRFASAYVMKYFSPSRLMGVYGLTNVALLLFAILRPGWLGMWCVFLTSLFMSVMFPTIFALGLKGLGPNTKIGGSLLVMAIVGGAVLTPVMGLVSERTHSLALSYSVPLVAYVVILLYSFWGSRPRAI